MSEELALVTKKELSLLEDNGLNERQLAFLLRRTPKEYVRKRPAKGGGEWDYVSGGYVKKCLNLMFGWNWDFEITNQMILHGEAIVQGKLTCRSNGVVIVKTQFGNKDIIYKTETRVDENGKTIMETKNEKEVAKKFKSDTPLSIGNDLKAAATDCLKKCAAELGIAADIYNKMDFREVEVVDESQLEDKLEAIKTLFVDLGEKLTKEQFAHAERIIDNKEVKSYNKLLSLLESLNQIK